MPAAREYSLTNGVRVVSVTGSADEVWRVVMAVDGGVCESSNRCVPTVAAPLLRAGCGDMTPAEVSDLADYNGATLNFGGHSHTLTASVLGLTSRFEQLLHLPALLISQPRFDDKETDLELRRAAQRLAIDMQKVSFHSELAANRLVMGATHTLVGTDRPDDFLEITPDEIRSYYNNVFSPERLTLYIAGRLTEEQERRLVGTFEALPATAAPAFAIDVKPFTDGGASRVDVPVPGANQACVSLNLPAVLRDHPDYVPLRFLCNALGGYFGSRLNANIRERLGYTYGISAALYGMQEGGYIRITAQCSPEYVDPLIEEVRRELTRMAEEPPTGEELERVRRHYVTRMVGQLDSPFTISDYYLNRQLVATPDDYFARQQEVVHSLGTAEMAELSRRYLRPEALSIAVAG